MAINRRRLLFLAVFLFAGLSVYAQSAGYFIESEGDRPRFIQRLVWSGGEYALRYEVVIERDDNGTYRNYHREFTTELYINISLHPGNYRFRVIPYDILNRPGGASEWKYIQVLPALQPELFTALPEYVTSAAGEESYGYLLNLTGYNIDPDAEIFIRRADGTQVAIEKIDSGDDIKVFLESDTLISGEYEVVIRNPGGLEASITGVPLLTDANHLWESVDITEPAPVIETHISEEKPPETDKGLKLDTLKPVIFSAGLAFTSLFPIYGEYVEDDTSTFGLTARLNLLFYIPIGIYIGPELSAAGYIGNYPDSNGLYTSMGNDRFNFTLMAGGNLLVRKWFSNQRAAFSFRAGADFRIVPDSIEQIDIRMDISFLWRVTNKILLEAGVDYSHLVWKTEHLGILSEHSGGFIRPWLGIGWQF